MNYWVECISPKYGEYGKKFEIMGFHETSDYNNVPKTQYGGDNCYHISEQEYNVLKAVRGNLELLKNVYEYLDQHFSTHK